MTGLVEVVDLYVGYYIEVEKAGEGVELPLSLCALPTTLTLSTPDCVNSPARALSTEPLLASELREPNHPIPGLARRNSALLEWDTVERDQA